jgi:hypothetical protein
VLGVRGDGPVGGAGGGGGDEGGRVGGRAEGFRGCNRVLRGCNKG